MIPFAIPLCNQAIQYLMLFNPSLQIKSSSKKMIGNLLTCPEFDPPWDYKSPGLTARWTSSLLCLNDLWTTRECRRQIRYPRRMSGVTGLLCLLVTPAWRDMEGGGGAIKIIMNSPWTCHANLITFITMYYSSHEAAQVLFFQNTCSILFSS